MGAAKRRGDYETRQSLAIARNEALQATVDTLPKSHPMRQTSRRYGTQRLAVALLSMGLLNPMPKE
jgi:hypothetical protein